MGSSPLEYKYNKCLQEEDRTNISKFTNLEYFHSLEKISLLLFGWEQMALGLKLWNVRNKWIGEMKTFCSLSISFAKEVKAIKQK